MLTETEGTLLWEPSQELVENTHLTRYMRWLGEEKGLSFSGYEELWRWSVAEIEGFWESIWEFCGVKSHGSYSEVLSSRQMPTPQWFPGARLNFAEHVFANAEAGKAALVHRSELRELGETGWGELREQVGAIAACLKEMGIQRGDRVVAYMPNVPETVAAFLACASIGAVWSSCSPDFGAPAVIDRFAQIEPKVLFACDGYRYNGKDFDRTETVAEIQKALPALQKTVLLPYLKGRPDTSSLRDVVLWDDFLAGGEGAELEFDPLPFDHPLWVLYSSGTTGLPKAIVQGHGGILLEHLKKLYLHMDTRPGDRFFWFTTTGWMMWNVVVGGMLSGAAALLYDGSPAYPDMNALWRFASETGMTHFGTSAAYITACMNAGIEPGREFDLSSLRAIGSTGSPLPPEGFRWAYESVKEDLWLFSTSGGTDLCTAFVGGSPTLPVRAGELQCRSLGAAVEAFDEEGNSIIDEVGELVITEPMPSMPLYLWGDEGGEKYRQSYFDVFPGVWRHGDWIRIKSLGPGRPAKSAVIYGRSDATINRGGVRMGTAEIYRAVETLPEISDSLVVDTGDHITLFVVLSKGEELNEELVSRIKHQVREACSPRHVPDEVVSVPEVPRTLNGKKLEVPVKKILAGKPVEQAASRDSLANPQAIDFFVEYAGKTGKD